MLLNNNSLSLFNEVTKKDDESPKDNNYAKTTYDAYKSVFKFKDNLEKIDPYSAASAYSALYAKVKAGRVNVTREIDKVKNNYLVDTIVHQMSEDALTPEVGTTEILEVKSDNKKILKAVAELEEIIDLDQLAKDIAPEAILYGEYTLKTEINYNNKSGSAGITDLLDVVDQGSVVTLSKNGKQKGFLVYSREENKVTRVSNALYVKFILGGARERVENEAANVIVKNKKVQQELDRLPKFVRVGRSAIYPLIEKIKELELVEKLVPATKLSKMSGATLIGLSVPENQEIETALAATRKVEGLINKKLNVDPKTEELTVEDILATTGKLKVVPLFGDKGSLEKLDFKSDEPDDLLGSVHDLRETICNSIGIPYELLYRSDSENKAEYLRKHSRYVNRLKNIQNCISNGVKQLIYIHLANSNIPFKKEEIDISFRNTLPNIDNLDRVEHADITISGMSNIKDFFEAMLEEDNPFSEYINLDVILEYIESNMRTIGLTGAINLDKLKDDNKEEKVQND